MQFFVSELPLLRCLCSGKASEGNGAVRGGRQQHLPGVSAAHASGNRQVALPAGGKEETGEKEDFGGIRKVYKEWEDLFCNVFFFLSVKAM